MNAEQKQALIERCEKISQWREKYGDYANVMLPAVEAQQIAQIALAALTAPPVSLPELQPWRPLAELGAQAAYRSLVVEAIHSAGYQVEGE
ncbi:hypothetical protein [Pantoea agglomerans]|uniref:hypothetical protein n=1 Tax=Enterobacter agglomerans TaxID=549 RepID=UPI00241372D8|nr:hypothetical protein [Pantoea agglomerans]